MAAVLAFSLCPSAAADAISMGLTPLPLLPLLRLLVLVMILLTELFAREENGWRAGAGGAEEALPPSSFFSSSTSSFPTSLSSFISSSFLPPPFLSTRDRKDPSLTASSVDHTIGLTLLLRLLLLVVFAAVFSTPIFWSPSTDRPRAATAAWVLEVLSRRRAAEFHLSIQIEKIETKSI